jgi:hypothetical protein
MLTCTIFTYAYTYKTCYTLSLIGLCTMLEIIKERLLWHTVLLLKRNGVKKLSKIDFYYKSNGEYESRL